MMCFYCIAGYFSVSNQTDAEVLVYKELPKKICLFFTNRTMVDYAVMEGAKYWVNSTNMIGTVFPEYLAWLYSSVCITKMQW